MRRARRGRAVHGRSVDLNRWGHDVLVAFAAIRELRRRLAADDRLPLDRAALDALLADPGVFVGTAGSQVQAVVERIGEVVAARPTAAAYDPEPIL